MTVDESAIALRISRNVVTQSLSNLEVHGFVLGTVQSSTGGRPNKRYSLTASGKEVSLDTILCLLIRLLSNKV